MADGGVEAHFDCSRIFEGYSHRIHGGVIAALLDGAMTNCCSPAVTSRSRMTAIGTPS
jgi:acyl-coenzyme A thioesterase PaaI-like protein